MIRITVSQYLNSNGEVEYQAFLNWEPICKNSADESFVSAFANAFYHQKPKAVLTRYNGTTGAETIIEAKGYTKQEIKKFKLAQSA